MIGLRLGDGAMDVLCLGAHPDDIEIGCGGTLMSLADRGDAAIHAVVLTGGEARLAETRCALDALTPGATMQSAGLRDGRLPTQWGAAKDYLEEVAGTRPAPHLVLAPRVDDAHQDHRLLGRLASTVWRDSLLLHYEIPKWDGDLNTPTHYVALSESVARRKVEILNACFTSQAGRDWWDDELFLGLMRMRGVEARSRYAEGFFATKVLLDVTGADRRSG